MASLSFSQFLFEEGVTDENGRAIMTSTTPTRRRRTNAQIKNALQDSLLIVFNTMSANNLSFQDFLVATFNSTNEIITHRVGQFYRREGPAAIMHIWREKLESTDHDESFAIQAIKTAAKRVRADLDHAAKDTSLKHPADSISHKTIRNFKLESLRSALETSAPHLTLLLRKLQPKSKQHLQTDSPWRSRAFRETMPPPTVERPPWLSVPRSESDLDATSEDAETEQDTVLGWESDPNLSSVTEGQCEQDS
ncbi:hypothetical protein BGZ52_005115, partial [Haplosporangium bisporale]